MASNAVPLSSEDGSLRQALIAHAEEELAAKLNNIVAIHAELLGSALTATQRTQIHEAHALGWRALDSLGELAALSGVEGGILALDRTLFSLRDHIADLIREPLQRAERKMLVLSAEIDADVPDGLVGDPDKLGRVIVYLLREVIETCDEGEIALQIEAEFITAQAASLAFAVVGSLPRPTQSADPQTPPIALAEQLVGRMGGKLVATTTRAGARQFQFSLLFGMRNGELEAAASPRYASVVGMPVVLAFQAAGDRAPLAGLFHEWRMQPLEADSGAMTIALLERAVAEALPIPLVVVGNRVGAHNGFLLALRIKRNPRLKDTLIIMLTTQGARGDAMRCKENGVAAYLPMPVVAKDLHDAVIAITGAALATDSAATLVTRHSLREQRHRIAVLLVDGDPDRRPATNQLLDASRHDVVVAVDEKEALAVIARQQVDLVLVALDLPGSDGCVRAIRAARAGSPLPMIGIGGATTENREHWLAAGIDTCLESPPSKEALAAAITARLGMGG